MSLKISNASGTFDLQKDFNTEIEDSSPIYNERGSQSIAATIPGTKKNLRLNKHIERTDIDTAPAKDDRKRIYHSYDCLCSFCGNSCSSGILI